MHIILSAKCITCFFSGFKFTLRKLEKRILSALVTLYITCVHTNQINLTWLQLNCVLIFLLCVHQFTFGTFLHFNQ